MNGKINEYGRLEIKRGEIFKEQSCCYSNGGSHCACGDTCPLFGEPIFGVGMGVINICQNRRLEFESLIDERNQEI